MNQNTTQEQLVILTKENMINCMPGEQMREVNTDKVEELKQSILEVGLLNPILIRAGENSFQVIAGAHRWAAMCNIWTSTQAEISCPAKIIVVADEDVLELQIRENLERNDLTASEKVKYAEILKQRYNIRKGNSVNATGTMDKIADEVKIPKRTLQRMSYVTKNGEPFLVALMDSKKLTPNECENIIKDAKKNKISQQDAYNEVLRIQKEANDAANAANAAKKGGASVDGEGNDLPEFLQGGQAPTKQEIAKLKREFKKTLGVLEGDIQNLQDCGVDVDYINKALTAVLNKVK